MNDIVIDQRRIPKHVAIIMDGNGRWAKQKGEMRIFGHTSGVDSVREALTAAGEIGVEYLTLYAFSTENQNRPGEEKSGLMRLLQEFLKRELKTMMGDEVRLRAIGDLNGLPEFARNAVTDTIEKTKANEKWNLTLALNYGSRQEILQAVQSYARQANGLGEDLNWETFSSYLQTRELPDPDLIIRTSGEFRLSNFLLLQAAYAEIFVSPLHWPDFGQDAFIDALSSLFSSSTAVSRDPSVSRRWSTALVMCATVTRAPSPSESSRVRCGAASMSRSVLGWMCMFPITAIVAM